MSTRHCHCGEAIPEGRFWCSPECMDADTAYSPEDNPEHGSSTIWDKDR